MDTEITIKLDKRSKQAIALYEYMKTIPFVVIEEPRYNNVNNLLHGRTYQ